MTAKLPALLFADLGIAESFSRPHVSDDNPYSGAHCKTFKYPPDYPNGVEANSTPKDSSWTRSTGTTTNAATAPSAG